MKNKLKVFFEKNPIKVLSVYGVFIVAAYSLLSFYRHWHFQSGAFDLGVFDQSIWHYSRFEKPDSSLTGLPNILADHFHPALMLLAPLYWILPKAETLLFAQAVLLMLPIFPIFFFGRKRFGDIPAICFSASYSILWGIQLAAEFDFHEISLAVPLIAFSIYFIDQKRWRSFFICSFLLLTVKEDMCLLVAFFGIYLLSQKEFKKGLATMIVGILAFWLEMNVLMPYFAEGHPYKFWSFSQLGSGPLEALKTCLTQPWLVLKILFSNQTKVITMFCIFAPFLMMAFFSPWILLTVPLICERMLSTGSCYWVINYHYTAVISPVVTCASADGLFRLSKYLRNETTRKKVILLLSGLCLLLNVAVLRKMPIRKVLKPVYYRLTDVDLAAPRALALIPDNASVLAQDTIVPHLSHRSHIRDIMPETITPPPTEDYIIACKNLQFFFFKKYDDINDFLLKEMGNGYRKIFDEQGWVVLQKVKS